jgi:hypothetical protein
VHTSRVKKKGGIRANKQFGVLLIVARAAVPYIWAGSTFFIARRSAKRMAVVWLLYVRHKPRWCIARSSVHDDCALLSTTRTSGKNMLHLFRFKYFSQKTGLMESCTLIIMRFIHNFLCIICIGTDSDF